MLTLLGVDNVGREKSSCFSGWSTANPDCNVHPGQNNHSPSPCQEALLNVTFIRECPTYIYTQIFLYISIHKRDILYIYIHIYAYAYIYMYLWNVVGGKLRSQPWK